MTELSMHKEFGRYMFLHIMNILPNKVFYRPGRYVLPASKTTDFFYANVRIQVNPKDQLILKK